MRLDGRKFDEVRPIWIETGVLPRTHGSAVFTRGETQALVTCTLGTADDAQKIESFEGETWKSFMLHYNFPPFSVGEVGFMRGPGRREVGHGALAERSLTPMMPAEEQFPYTVRIVSDILESNGSSSMASVCGGSLAMMDAGVPLKSAVAGIAMGLVMDEKSGKYAVLSDIAGAEDHYGDMDFKVAGTSDGITALQMDIKVGGITTEIMRKALDQARRGRLHILDKMRETIAQSRESISLFAPRIVTIRIPVDKIRDVIGPGGKMIRSIIERTGVKIDVEDDGRVNVASADGESAQKAISIIQELTATPELNKSYLGKIQRITDFGAFVEIMPGTDGLLHVSEIANHRVKDVRDELKEGEQILVKVINIDPTGKIRLSRKALLQPTKAPPPAHQPAAKARPIAAAATRTQSTQSSQRSQRNSSLRALRSLRSTVFGERLRPSLTGWLTRTPAPRRCARGSAGGCRTATATIFEGCSSARFCAPSRRIAEMNAPGFLRQVERKAIGAPLVGARHGVRDRHHHAATRPRRPAAAAAAPRDRPRSRKPEAGRSSPPSSRGRQIEAGENQRALEDNPLPDVAVHVMRQLVRQHDLDFVVRILGQHRVGHQDPPRAADAGERRVRLLRLLAESPFVRAEDARARALGEREQPRAQRLRDRAASRV